MTTYYWCRYLVPFISICLVILFYSIGYSRLTMNVQTTQVISNKISNISNETSSTRQPYHESRFDAPRSNFDIQVNVELKHCVQPLEDSRRLGDNLNFMWRAKWAPIYRRGCWAPTFSKIDKVNNTLIIDCPPSMTPMYGFQNRLKVTQNYTGPVSLGNQEWVYAQCHLPFYLEPTVRLHFCAQPLPVPSFNVTERPNVVFLQFDAMGRQTMYRRMPRSYKLLSTYAKTNSSSSSLAELKSVEAVELPHLNVNGRNSEPNMRQVYCAGVNCENTSLLRLYKQTGYSTSLLESYSEQLPNYIPSNAVDRVLARNYFSEYTSDTVELYNKKSGCVTQTTWIVDEMLDYLQDRFTTMRRGGWFSINNIIDAHSEDELNNYAVMDTKFHDFLLALDQSKALDNTILILLGDHGLHGHDWTELWREFDHRNPFLQILVGKQVTRSADIIRHLEANSDKLVSHADIYMTFAKFSNSSLPRTLPNTVDLIQDKISSNRTCRTAGIPDEWCNCWLPKASSKVKQ